MNYPKSWAEIEALPDASVMYLIGCQVSKEGTDGDLRYFLLENHEPVAYLRDLPPSITDIFGSDTGTLLGLNLSLRKGADPDAEKVRQLGLTPVPFLLYYCEA